MRAIGKGPVEVRERLNRAELSEEAKDALEKVFTKRVELRAGSLWREQGTPRDQLVFVRAGLLEKSRVKDGGARTIGLRFPGEAILPGDTSAQYATRAVVHSEVLIGRKEDLDEVLVRFPEVAALFWKAADRYASITAEWLYNLSSKGAQERVAHLFCETAWRSGTAPELLINPFTQRHIAAITGQTSVNTNRVTMELERSGLLTRENDRIVFNDWPELCRLAGFSPAYLQ